MSMSGKRPTWFALVVALGSSVAIAVCCAYLTKHHMGAYPISTGRDGVIVSLGEIEFPCAPLRITVPLERLGFQPGLAAHVRATCGCTSASLGPDQRDVQIAFAPRRDMTEVHERVFVEPKDHACESRVIHLTGNVVPLWTASPGNLLLEHLWPDEQRGFSCRVSLGSDLPQEWSCKLLPAHEGISLRARQLDTKTIQIDGVATGSALRVTYRGEIKFRLPFEGQDVLALGVPIVVEHVGAVTAEPAVLTLSSQARREAIVSFKGLNGRRLHIKSIECPPYLYASVSQNGNGACSLKVALGNLVSATGKRVNAAKMKVSFQEPGLRAEVPVVVLGM